MARRVRRHRELRTPLLELLEAGAPVEPGRRTVEVRRLLSRRLTVGKLSAVIGADLVATFLDEIGPTLSRRLDVRESADRPDPGPGGPVRRGPADGIL